MKATQVPGFFRYEVTVSDSEDGFSTPLHALDGYLMVARGESWALGKSGRGFTLIEVLVAMAITALISAVAYGALSSALSAAESVRSATVRSHDINQTLTVLSRDIRQVVNRSIIDEFNQPAPALSGGY